MRERANLQYWHIVGLANRIGNSPHKVMDKSELEPEVEFWDEFLIELFARYDASELAKKITTVTIPIKDLAEDEVTKLDFDVTFDVVPSKDIHGDFKGFNLVFCFYVGTTPREIAVHFKRTMTGPLTADCFTFDHVNDLLK